MMDVVEITNKEWVRNYLNFVATSQESKHLETKRVSGKMVGKALETVCAFANSEGGSLILGVEDIHKAQGAHRLLGIEENPEAIDELLRKLTSQITPTVPSIKAYRIKFSGADGRARQLLTLIIPASDKVHSIRDGGTWSRGEASNREMSASEITELSYRRGVRSAESEPVEVDFDLLDTDMWRLYLRGRQLSPTGLPDQLYRIGLAKKIGGELKPVRAAVLLFAEYPGALLANMGTRADVRVFHYKGTTIEHGEVPNLKKPPKTLSASIYALIAQTHAYVLDEIAGGLTLASSGFKTIHRYPERVIKEAITNALIHRDYRLNRDVQIRIFDNRIEILSPGLFPGRITPATVHRMSSFARNPLLSSNLREFPEPPNVDAGEGVRMMFNVMRASNLYPPQYRELRDEAQEAIVVTLLNEERPPIWEQVSDWIDRNGPISNREICGIAAWDTLKTSKMLKKWVDQGLLMTENGNSKRHTVYRKPSTEAHNAQANLLSTPPDNETP